MTLEIKLENSDCRPGQMLVGSIFWEFDSIPAKLTLEVSWQTSGKGTDDSETVYTEDWTPDSKIYEKKFKIPMPRGPISVQGNLVSISWQIDCTSKRPNETCTMPFVLSHIGQPVRLTPVN